MLTVGQKVNYVPDLCHAFDTITGNRFAWSLGQVHRIDGDDVVKVLTTEGMLKLFNSFNRDFTREKAMESLIPVRPTIFWEGKVVESKDEGKYLVEVKHPLGHAVFEYVIPESEWNPSDPKPHTCHAASETPSEEE